MQVVGRGPGPRPQVSQVQVPQRRRLADLRRRHERLRHPAGHTRGSGAQIAFHARLGAMSCWYAPVSGYAGAKALVGAHRPPDSRQFLQVPARGNRRGALAFHSRRHQRKPRARGGHLRRRRSRRWPGRHPSGTCPRTDEAGISGVAVRMDGGRWRYRE